MSKDTVCNKYNTYILFITLARLFDSFIYGFNHNETFKEIRFASEDFSNHILVHRFFYYIGTFILGYFFSVYGKNSLKKEEIKHKKEKKEKKEKIEKKENKNESKHNINKIEIESISDKNLSISESNKGNDKANSLYIYHDLQNEMKTPNLALHLLLTLIIWIIIEKLIDSYFVTIQDLDFWMIEILIISILNLKFKKKPIYKHQIFAIVLSIISSFFKIQTIILSFQDDTETKYYKDIPDKENYNGHLPIIYKKNPIVYITLGIGLYLILIFMRACIYLAINHFMEIKYIMPSNIIKDFGAIGIIICFLMCLLSTFIYCKEIDNKIEIYNYICKVTYNNQLFFDNFISFFIKLYNTNIGEKFKEIGIIIFGFLTFFTDKYFTILIIKELSPVHVIFSVPISYFLQKSIVLLYTRISEGKYYIVDNKYKIQKFNLDMSGDAICFFGFLIYLEIFVLTICNCNYNTKKEINKRANHDRKTIGVIDIDDSDSSNKEEDINEIGDKSSQNLISNEEF